MFLLAGCFWLLNFQVRKVYKQAPQYNPDGSHGPLLCAAYHDTNKAGVPIVAEALTWKGKKIKDDLDAAISWIHSNAPDLGGKNPK